MPWSNQGGGGPWGGGGGGGQSPWGGGGRGGGPQQPNIEEMLKRSQDRFKRFLPGGFGGWKVIALIVIALAIVWMVTGLYRVEPREIGVELVFGKVRNTTPEGLHFNWPAPIGAVETPNVQGQRLTVVGAPDGSNDRSPAASMVADDGLMLTGDRNIINIRAAVLWRVSAEGLENLGQEPPPEGVMDFLFNIRAPQTSVKDATEAALREIVGKSRFEFVRTEGRGPIEEEAGELIQGILDGYGAGVQVMSVELQRTDPPPGDVFDAFRDVETAEQNRQTTINQAQAYRNQVVQEAQGQADQIRAQSEGYRQTRINEAEGEASRFLAVYGEYQNNAEVTRQRIYLETMSEVLSRMDKTLIDELGGSGVVPYLPLNELNKGRRTTQETEGGAAAGGSGSAPAPAQGGN